MPHTPRLTMKAKLTSPAQPQAPGVSTSPGPASLKRWATAARPPAFCRAAKVSSSSAPIMTRACTKLVQTTAR